MNPLSASTKQAFQSASTATISTALFKRGLRSQVMQNVHPLHCKTQNMVGPAFTLRYIPAREDLNHLSTFDNPEHPQRAAIEACPSGAVLVMDSRQDARAASAGSILATRLMVRGGAGIVTDGGFRDSLEIAQLEMPAYHQRASAPTNLTLHQAVDINVPIGCGGAAVWPGDIVVGDGEAVVVVPAELADEVAAEAIEMTAFEEFVTQEVHNGRSIIGLYPATDAQVQQDYLRWRAANKR